MKPGVVGILVGAIGIVSGCSPAKMEFDPQRPLDPVLVPVGEALGRVYEDPLNPRWDKPDRCIQWTGSQRSYQAEIDNLEAGAVGSLTDRQVLSYLIFLKLGCKLDTSIAAMLAKEAERRELVTVNELTRIDQSGIMMGLRAEELLAYRDTLGQPEPRTSQIGNGVTRLSYPTSSCRNDFYIRNGRVIGQHYEFCEEKLKKHNRHIGFDE
jgi:hypothetical protein